MNLLPHSDDWSVVMTGLFMVVRNGGLPGTSTSTTNLYLGGLPLPWSVPRISFFLSTMVALAGSQSRPSMLPHPLGLPHLPEALTRGLDDRLTSVRTRECHGGERDTRPPVFARRLWDRRGRRTRWWAMTTTWWSSAPGSVEAQVRI